MNCWVINVLRNKSNESTYDEEASDDNVEDSETEDDESAPDWDELEEKARRGIG